MKRICIALLALLLCAPVSVCAAGYASISPETAMEMMALEDGHVILDVRTPEEFAYGHIPGAVLLPNETIGGERPEALPDPEQILLIYCRSGVRSKQAAQKLADLGYTHVYEFGGILSWPGEIVTDDTEDETMKLWIGETEVPVIWEENASVEALQALCPLTIQLSMYGGFEQVGPIGQEIAREDTQIHTAPGDIVLYSGDQIVLFYGNNSWAYTRLGHIDLSAQEMADLLSHGDVEIRLE